MIRPIDTQILYPQTVELSQRQQKLNRSESLQQQQFSDIINKKVKENQDTIEKSPKTEHVTNNLKKDNKDNDKKKKKPMVENNHCSITIEENEDSCDYPKESKGFDIKI